MRRWQEAGRQRPSNAWLAMPWLLLFVFIPVSCTKSAKCPKREPSAADGKAPEDPSGQTEPETPVAEAPRQPFVPDPELAAFWRPLDARYFELFKKTVDMLHRQRYDGLDEWLAPIAVRGGCEPGDSGAVASFEPPPMSFRYRHKPALAESASDGHPIRFPIDWKANPNRDASWAFAFHSLGWLDIALDAGERGDDESAMFAFKVIQDWLLSNADWPPKNGRFIFHDHGSAVRLRVLARAMGLYEESGICDPLFEKQLRAGLVTHISLLATTERYLAWHNHGIIIDRSLLDVLENLEGFKGQQEIQELAKRRILEQFRFAFTTEGGHREHSPCYHYLVSAMLKGAIDQLESAGFEIPSLTQDLLAKTADFAAHLAKPDGSLPGIGDCTEGQRFRFRGPGRDYLDQFPQLQCAVHRGDRQACPPNNAAVYPATGWAVFRNGWRLSPEESVYAAVQSDFFSFGHYQEDDTSFVLSIGGYDLITDPGLHSYNRQPLDAYMRKARAHNVLIVDGKDFDFDLDNTGLSGITRFELEVPLDDGLPLGLVELTHAHYSQMGVAFHRQFGPIGERAFLIRDLVKTESPHEYSQLFHLRPKAEIKQTANGVFRIQWHDWQGVLWMKSTADDYRVVRGQINPVQGWLFPEKGESVKAPVLILKDKGRGLVFQTVLLAAAANESPDWHALRKASKRLVNDIETKPRSELKRMPQPPQWDFRR